MNLSSPPFPLRSVLLTLVALAWPVLATPGSLPAQDRPVQPEDHYREVSVGQTAMSPAGDLLAFTVTRVREEENDRMRAIWMQRLSGGEPQGAPFQFTSSAHDAHSPLWSPDGSLLSFESNRDDSGNRVWFIRVDQPAGEAFRIEGVDAPPLWSPDGEWIALVRRPEAEGADDARRVAPDAISAVENPDRFDGHVITHANFRQNGTTNPLPHPDAVPTPQLWVVPAEGGEARQVTDVPFQVMGPAWSADSRGLIFVGNHAEPAEYDQHRVGGDLYAVLRDGGEVRTLTEEGSATYSDPAVSPDGGTLAFLRRSGQGEPTGLFIVDVDSGFAFQEEPRMLVGGRAPEHPSRSSGSPEWGADGTALRYDDLIGGDRHLFEVQVDVPGEVRQVTEGERRLSGFTTDVSDRWLAYVSTAPTRPGEVFLADRDGADEVQVTHFNRDWIEEVVLSDAQVIRWTVADGTEIEGWVLPPVDFDPDRRYPMVMSIHGGPHAAFGNNYSHQFQVMAGQGYFVFYPNPRGSSAYGHDFTYVTRAAWGLMDEEDFLTGVEAVLERHPQIDRDRVGVMGGSYGGYMTNWLTARSDIFAAAVTRATISNWKTTYLSGDAQQALEWEFGGPPHEAREVYRASSPLSHVENVTTPTLILHGELDFRTPMTDAEQWYLSLVKGGVPAEFVRYPESAHGGWTPWRTVDGLERTLSWMNHWLVW
jgi:dipeptidyl aminopeptidase/acylaminoacyl peptidase